MVRYSHDGHGHTIVQGTLTGDGFRFEIELNGVHNLTASDFVL
jgi:hypothetical protein